MSTVQDWLAAASEGLAKEKEEKKPARRKKPRMHIRPTEDEKYIVEHDSDDYGVKSEHAPGGLKELHTHLDKHYGEEEKEPQAEEEKETPAQEAAEVNDGSSSPKSGSSA